MSDRSARLCTRGLQFDVVGQRAHGEHVIEVPVKRSARERSFDTGRNSETDAPDAHAVAVGVPHYRAAGGSAKPAPDRPAATLAAAARIDFTNRNTSLVTEC